MVPLSKTIFKAYDIRGIIDKTLDAGIAQKIGHAFGMALRANGEQRVLIGRDGRLSGPALSAALASGLQSAGIAVLDLGIVATPLLYFGTSVLGVPSGIMVTGSHNPANYNGFKMVQAGAAIHGEAIQDLYRSIVANELPSAQLASAQLLSASQQDCNDSSVNPQSAAALLVASANKPAIESAIEVAPEVAPAVAPVLLATHDIGAAYRARIVGDITLTRPIKIAIDCGNGVAGAFAGDLYRALGCDVIELFCDVDGSFPNHHPDPAKPENLQHLIDCLRQTDAEIGLAFDGDGDRLGVVTKDGQIIYPDRQLMLFAADVLAHHPGRHILYDVKCTRNLAPWIRAHGGVPLMWKTGHSLLKAKMRETDAALAGEMSGHIMFGERWYGFDDALYAGARLLEIVTRVADASALLNSLPQSLCTPELQLTLAEGDNAALLAELLADSTAHLRASDPDSNFDSDSLSALSCSAACFPGHQHIVAIDGLRVDYADGFGLIRASNTTPTVTLRFEADTEAGLARIAQQFKSVILARRPDALLPILPTLPVLPC